MKSIAQLFFVLSSAVLAMGQQIQFVPGGLANVEGNSSVAAPFNSQSFRFQQVFDASQFSFIGGATARIDRISFRIDGAATADLALFFGGSSWTLSTTTRGPDGLSPIFADNRGADQLTVRNGAFSFGGLTPPIGGPGTFQDPTVTLTTPFFYIPSQGNLLLEVRGGSGQVFLPGNLDGHSFTGDSISWVYANSEFPTSGTVETFGLVTRFDITIVPEPSTVLMMIAGFGILATLRRR